LTNASKIVLITFFSNLYFYNHVGTLYFLSRGLTLLEASSLTSIIVLSIFLAEVPTGVLADRIGRKWAVVMALLLQTLGEVLFLFATTYLAFAIIAMIAGVGFAFASGAVESLMYDSLPAEGRELAMKKAMGRMGSAYNAAFFLGPLLGGILVTEYILPRYLLVIGLTACSVAVALLISLTLDDPHDGKAKTASSALAIFRNGINDFRDNATLRHILLVTVFTAPFLGSLVALYQPYFVAADMPPFLVGAGLAAGGLLAAVLQRYAYLLQEVLGERLGLVIATMLPGVMYVVLAFAAGAAVVFVAFVLTYAVLEIKKPLLSAIQNRHISDSSRATTLSIINMLTSLFVAIMTVVYGALADRSLSLTFFVMGVMITVAAMVLRVDRLASQPDANALQPGHADR
jgi:MFS family permease